MTHVICRALSCVYWAEGICGAEEMEYEPDVGCLTFQDLAELEDEEEDGEDLSWDSDASLYNDDDDDDWDDDDDEWDEDLR